MCQEKIKGDYASFHLKKKRQNGDVISETLENHPGDTPLTTQFPELLRFCTMSLGQGDTGLIRRTSLTWDTNAAS